MDINICYEWLFSAHVQNRKGRTYRQHLQRVLGSRYNEAKETLERDLKRKKWTLISINSATPLHVSHAYYKTPPDYPWVPLEEYKNLPKPPLPNFLNYCSPYFIMPNCRVRCTCTQKYYETQL